jgi:hypothetical protein
MVNERPIELKPKVDVTMDKAMEYANGRSIVVCDTNIKEIENSGVMKKWGYEYGNIVNIDHHFSAQEFSRWVSSANLAIAYVKDRGIVGPESAVLINHADCDSILSSAIIAGILPPDDEFGIAAIAADHTGEANEIADLLQAVETERNIVFSLKNLQHHLLGKALDPKAAELLEKRMQEREEMARLASEKFNFSNNGKVAYFEADRRTDAGLLPAVLPTAEIILLFHPLKDQQTGALLPGKEVKARLGLAAPAGMDLQIIMARVDEGFKGRWNAGSNGRNGGTDLTIKEYADKVITAMAGYKY